ncbi:3-oxoacyl-ACP synthase III family protein [Stratiformator vulcanicus]|uniref:Beta-ketoacyl-[acyl-carrier-protein] synthase III n=1 Tax=Stratiformator vulcanicus TaxID=2527980 RepID=A0A517R6L5_9PLAN|nr:beta-ketoacyl-ACP synthase III [Stratiformator vulcanicus]QDT39483.1 3-oxoacyl-[acyl-carrier-protein] synthase 3 [Stratiformator vulcanicus]
MQENSPHYPAASPTGKEAAVAVKSRSPAAEQTFRRSDRTNRLTGIRIVGTGSYVPDRVVTNHELEQSYGFEPGWIERRSGILERRYAFPHQATSDLCYEAAKRAMEAAGVTADEIDLCVVGTFTPDSGCPSTACLVQDRLGLDAPAFDVQAACSGFMYALMTASQFVATGNSRLALVIGGDVNSRIVDAKDQRTAPLFGDGAGAVLVSRGGPEQGLVCYQAGADGSGGPLLEMVSGGTRKPSTAETVAAGEHFLQMDGRNVFKWAVRAVTETIDLVLEKSELSPHEISLYLLHQANARILKAAMDPFGVPPEKVWSNLDRYGNTSAASIPLAMDEAYRSGLIEPGDLLLMSGFGAGLTWNTGIFRW